MNYKKYKRFEKIALKDRKWCDNEITKAPIWCSVDLRDGNQALANPMNLDEKLELFNLLVDIGFKEIEIGFPSASKIEFEFCRYLIENHLIPDDVTISILSQAKKELIQRSFEAINGAKNIIFHLYNSTSKIQRKVVFKKSKQEIIDIALDGVCWIKECAKDFKGDLILEYSPESFTQTELEFSLDICNQVVSAWEPKKDEKVIINLPSTVEVSTPNIYADMIEFMDRELKERKNITLSIHNHNDRGCAVASCELGLLAGADRVEGTLLGNGERSGNVDITTVALNLFTQGVDPKLDFSKIDKIKKSIEKITKIKTHPRHPYVGDLVYSAFSGSHQDAISKGIKALKDDVWEVPYLPIDPKDVGRDYEAIIQINSQSGKGGVSFILEEYGYKLPKDMQKIVAKEVQKISEIKGGVLSKEQIVEIFKKEFVNIKSFYSIKNLKIDIENGSLILRGDFFIKERSFFKKIRSNGVIEALQAIYRSLGIKVEVTKYIEHAKEKGSQSSAISYIALRSDNSTFYGVGEDKSITLSSIKAYISALNQMHKYIETNSWDVEKYTKHADFVYKLAYPLIDLLDPKDGELILDLGCGNGELSKEISKRGAKVIGVDLNQDMVREAKKRGIDARVMSLLDLKFENHFDAVFSNAVLHWVKDAQGAIQNIHKVLKDGGRFVAEFGGDENIANIINAMKIVFKKYPEFGEFQEIWYFPTPKEYKELLQKEGFEIKKIELIPRLTPLDDIANWLEIFTSNIRSSLNREQNEIFIRESKEILKETNYSKKDGWFADYVRLRVEAFKV